MALDFDPSSARPAGKPKFEFDATTAKPAGPARTRGVFEAVNDTAIEFTNAAAGGVSSALKAVRPGNAASGWIDKNIIESGESKQSDVVRSEKAQLSSELDAAEGIWDEVSAVGGYVARNPVLAAAQAAGSFVGPAAAVKGASMAARAAGYGAKGVERAGRAGGVAAGAAMAGGDAAGTAYDLTKNAGATEDQAVTAGRQASVIPAVVGGVGGAFGAERLLAGAKGFAGSTAARAGKTAASEAAQEAVEEGVTQYEGQRAAVPFDESIDPTKGVAGAATFGAIMGGATGGVVGALSPGRSAPVIVPSDPFTSYAAGAQAYAAGTPAVPPEGIASDEHKSQWMTGWEEAREHAAAIERARSGAITQLRTVQQQERGEPEVPQTAPPDGASVLAKMRARQQAKEAVDRAARIDAGRAETSPDDEIYQSTGADVRPSVRMGLDPAAGPLSDGAAIAVDSGAADQMQAMAAAAQAAEQEGKGGKKPKPQPKVKKEAAPGAGVNQETGEITAGSMTAWNDADLSTAFRSAQTREVRLQLAAELSRRRTENEQQALQQELADELGAPEAPASLDNAFAAVTEDAGDLPAEMTATTEETPTDGPQTTQAQQTEAKPAAPRRPAAADPLASPAATARDVEGLRRQLREVEDRILQAAPSGMAAGGGDIEAAMRSRKVPVTLKAQRQKLRAQLQQVEAVQVDQNGAQAPAPAPVVTAAPAPAPVPARAAPPASQPTLFDEPAAAVTAAPQPNKTTIPGEQIGRSQEGPFSRPEQAPAVQVVAERQGSVQQPQEPVLSQLRRAGNNDGSRARSELPDIPGRGRGTAEPSAHTGPEEQRLAVSARESSMGNETRAGEQPTKERLADIQGADTDSRAVGRAGRDDAIGTPLPDQPGRDDARAGTDKSQERRPEQGATSTGGLNPAGKKPRGVLAKKAEAEEKARATYFTPGHIIRAYSGFDRVVSYTPPAGGQWWSVTVQAVEKKDGIWVDKAGERERTHSTQPAPHLLKVGPIAKVQRFDAGQALTKEERKSVLASLVDVYKAKGAPREQKGTGRDGNERYGYVHSPELFEKSDITGAMVRYYVTLPDGRKAHPTELFPDYTQSDIEAEMERRQNAEKRDTENVKGYTAAGQQFDTWREAEDYWDDRSAKSMKTASGLPTIYPALSRTLMTNGQKFIMIPDGVLDNEGMPAAFAAAGWRKTKPEPMSPAQPAPTPTVLKSRIVAAPPVPTARIDDLGEKIGGARKDTATSSGKARRAAAPKDERPAWARRFNVSQITRAVGADGKTHPDEGRWEVTDTRNLDWMKQPRRVGRGTFATQEEAEASVPLAAVSLKHRVSSAADGKWEIWRDISDRKRVKVVDRQFDNREAAMEYMAKHAAEIVETNTTFGEADLPLPPDRARTGPARRTGDVDGKAFMDTFGFRGVEFGNWNNQDERQHLMNDAFDGLMDLATVMDIPPKAIGLNGDLALAFGARGQGLNSARAHYEQERTVMNLTKERGAGSLAHEWFHALDHYLGRLDGKASAVWEQNADGTRTLKGVGGPAHDMVSHGFRFKSEVRPEVRDAYNAVIQTIFKKGTAYVEDTQKADNFVARAREELARALDNLRGELSKQKDATYYKRNNKPASAEQLAEFDAVAKRMLDGEVQALETDWRAPPAIGKAKIAYRWTNDSMEKLGAIFHAVRGRSGFNPDKDGAIDRLRVHVNNYSARLKMLAEAQSGTEKTRMVPTDFAMAAKELDQGRGTDYWTTPHEMAARAFQGFVEDKIAEGGNISRFLNFAPEEAGILTPWGVKRPFPHGEERKAINASLEAFVKVLQTKETDRGVAMFSRNPKEPTRELLDILQMRPRPKATVESVRAALRELVNGVGLLPNQLGRVVVTTSDKIVPEWQPMIGNMAQQAADPQGAAMAFFDPNTKTVFLLADRIPAGVEKAVTAHELMHKHGQAVLGAAGWDKLHGAIEGWAKAPDGSMERRVYDEAARRVASSRPDGADAAAYSSQELFPYAVQVAMELGVEPDLSAKPSTVARWLADVREALRQVWARIFGAGDARAAQFAAQDMVNLAFGIAQRENPAHTSELDGVVADAPVVDTEAFRRWFGDSKVVDAEGKPLVVYRSNAVDAVLSGQPQRLESGMNGLRGNAELIANLLQGPTFRLQGLGGFDAPTQRVVLAAVRSFGLDPKIFRSVVQLIPVDVMDVLTRKNLSAKSLFSDEAVLKKLLAIDGDGSISTAVDVADALVSAVTGVTTETAVVSTDGVGSLFDRSSASRASEIDVFLAPHGDVLQAINTSSVARNSKQTGNRGTFDPGNADIRFSRADDGLDTVFATEVLAELAAVDELYRWPVSRAPSLAGVFADTNPEMREIGDATREDERQESGADARTLYRNAAGKDFYVYEKGREVWVDVSRFEQGQAGDAVYHAVANYAHNTGKVFVGDPSGLSPEAIERRTYHMLGSALRFGQTKHFQPADEQLEGVPAKGIAPLKWTGNDADKIRSMIESFTATAYNRYPKLREYRYDFDRKQFVGPDGNSVTRAEIHVGQRPPGSNPARGNRRAPAAVVFLDSLARAESGQRPGLLAQALRSPAQLVAPLQGPLFSRAPREIGAQALDLINSALSHPGKVSIWDKTVGTMRNLAERAPAFKPVFESAQRFIDDVSMLGNDAADAAPRLLPRVDSIGDIIGKNRKRAISAEDNNAVAKPLFQGTLVWARDVDGKPILTDDLNAKYEPMLVQDKAQLMVKHGHLDPEVLSMWHGMPIESFERAVNTRFEKTILKPGLVWRESELRSQFNLTEQQIGLYREARAAIDRSIDVTARADILRALGPEYGALRDVLLEQPTLEGAASIVSRMLRDEADRNPDATDRIADQMQQVKLRLDKANDLMGHGYAPLSRFGRYTVDVVDADGERQYFGMFETQRDSNLMKQKMEAAFPGATVTQGTMSQEAYKLFAGITPESLELFGNMLGLQSDGNEARDKAFQEYLKLAKNNHSALKRLIHRKGIAGYSEDVGRVLASFVYSNARQAAGALNAGTMEQAINAIPKEQGELKDVAMGLQSYIRDPQEEGQAVRGMLFAQYLGGSLASAFVNMTQPFAVTLPWMSQYGGIKAAGAHLARALKDMAGRGHYEVDLARALKQAEDDGVVSPQEIHQLMAQARGTGSLRSGDGTRAGDVRAAVANNWERVKVAWGQPFALAEQFNRRSTFIAAYRLAKEQGINNPADFARRAVLETQFLYSKANKPRWARGAVGGTVFTFKTYSVSYLELMHRMWSQGGADGRRAVGWAMAMLLLMGGAGGLPFMEDAEDLIDGGGQLMGYNISTKQWRKQLLRDVLGAEFGEFIETGFSGLPGAPIDVSGRLGMGNLLPGTGLFLSKQNRERDLMEVVGPAGDLAARGFTGVRKALTGDVLGAAEEVSPTAVRNALKGIDMATSGIYKDTKGYKVLDTTLPEAAAKFLGFQPRSVAEVQEANSFMQRSKSFYIQTSSEIRAQWAAALFEKDEAALQRVRDRLASWNKDNPEQPIVVKMPDIWKRVREMGKNRSDRIADTAPKALRQQMREIAAGAN